MTDYNVRLQSQQDLEKFASIIKDAVCSSFYERFGRARLEEASLKYDDFFHRSNRGEASDNGEIFVRQTESALQLAGTVVHELAHILVGVAHNHDDLWREAGVSLGLTYIVASGQNYKPDHFRVDLLKAIEDAIAQLYKTNPEIVYPTDIPIPVPAYIGMPDCPDQREDCDHGHKVHVMQFQLDGVRWMLANPKNILYADDPGLGKTVGMMLYINATH